MKRLEKMATSIAKKTAEKTLKRDANSTTCAAVFQPKAPSNLSQFKKHKD
jgi:hypothetical protein